MSIPRLERPKSQTVERHHSLLHSIRIISQRDPLAEKNSFLMNIHNTMQVDIGLLKKRKTRIEKETLKLVKTKWSWNTPGPFLFWLMWNQCGSLLHNSSSSLSDRIQRWRATASAREWVEFTQWSPNSKSSQQAGSHNLLTAPKRLPGSGSCQCSLWGATGHRSRSTAVRATFYKIEARRISIT